MRYVPLLLAGLGLLLNTASGPAQTLPAQTLPAKIAIPGAAAIKAAAALVNDAFKTDIAAAKTPEQKSALVLKLLAAARDEQGPDRYVLLTKARDTAIDAGDLDDSDAALAALLASFDLDPLAVTSDAYIALARTVRNVADRRNLALELFAVTHAALITDHLAIAKSASLAAYSDAEGAEDAPLVQLASDDVRAVRETQVAFDALKSSLATLADKPADPAANAAVGKYHCLVAGDWKTGLPQTAAGNDPALKALAQIELALPATPDAQEKLADAWWDLSLKQVGLNARQIQQHAAAWYAAAVPSLPGLAKKKAETRILDARNTAFAYARRRRINLLALVDVTKDAVGGAWTFDTAVLASDAGRYSRLAFPYDPPAEYDYRIKFLRDQGNDLIDLILVGGGRQFSFTMGGWRNTITGFDIINGQSADKNKTGVHAKTILENGTRYDVVIKVRKTGVQAFVNDNLITAWQTDYTDMSISEYLALPDQHALGLASYESPSRFFKVEVTEIAGAGAITRAKDTPQPP